MALMFCMVAYISVETEKAEKPILSSLSEECWEDEMTEEIDTTEETDEEFIPT